MYLNTTALSDVLYFLSLAAPNRQLLSGLTQLVCPSAAAGTHSFHSGSQAVVVPSSPVDVQADVEHSAQAFQEQLQAQRAAAEHNASSTDDDVLQSVRAYRDAYTTHRASLLHQSAWMLWPVVSASFSPFTWLRALSESHSASASAGVGAGGYHPSNRLEYAVLTAYTAPGGERHVFLQEKMLHTCKIEFLPKAGVCV
jgi:hypothetical protein